jgi:uncharacterized repeat protein (TIGR01451 family)
MRPHEISRASRDRSYRIHRLRLLLALLAASSVAGMCAGGVLAGSAQAASAAQIAITADNPPPPSTPTGQASTYTINLTCSAVVGSSCGAAPTITIPLNLTSSNPATPAMSSWSYSASSTVSGLIASAKVVGGNYVITLNESVLIPGDSDTINLSVTPPNNITPDATSWSLTPSFSTTDIPNVTAPSPAIGQATAAAKLAVSKNTNDGGAVYVAGNNVIYTITARCNPGGATGNLYLQSGSLIDTLPAGLTFVSATPTPTTVAGSTVSWNYPTAGSLPSGCFAGGSGSTTYTLTALLNASVPNNTQLTNGVTFSGTPIGTSTPLSTTATRSITAITTSPGKAGSFLGKTARGPIDIAGFGYDATYAGHWIIPINPRPSSNPGAAEGQYTVSISYPASRAFETDLADPVPCLDTNSGVVYSSNTPSGAIAGASSINNLCQHPAFDPTVVAVSSASLVAAVNGGWRPIGIRPDGSTFSLTLNGSAAATTYFEVSTAENGRVAAIELPPSSNLTDVSMSMSVWGYGDASLPSGSDMHDIATATAYPVTGGDPSTQSHSADLYIEPNEPQLGVFKSFGALGAAPGGTTTLTLQGNVSTPAPVSGNVIMTDLLPYGLSWHNPVASAALSVTRAQGGTATTVTATVADIHNFDNTGRELIRVTLPASAFISGFYTITAPTNFVDLTVPAGATTYNNTDQLFVQGIADNTRPVCGPGTTSTPSTFESSDQLDLDGDGATNENYCQWAASLTVPPTGGPAFGLVKTVRGDLDSAPKFSPGIGNASPGGSGTYTLTWTNTGGKNLTSPVIYDILPYVGDTGVSQGQANVARGSQFATIFAGVSGSLPSGVSVAYSESTNPCRPEVYPNAADPGCVNDWTTTPPDPLSLVKALRFTAAGTYTPTQSFAVTYAANVPAGQVNTVAWNSAASDASYNGAALLPAEPPVVGLTASAPPVTPTLSTTASSTQVQPGGSISDSVLVGNTGGATGTLDWKLVGPLTPTSSGSCSGLDWSSAATVDSGTIAANGDGTYTTPLSAPAGAGCYGYAEELTGTAFAGPVTSPTGTAGEIVLVAQPATSTTLSSPASPVDGTASTSDPATQPDPAPTQSAQITIAKRVNHEVIALGKPLTYTLTITNSGPGTATGLTVTDSPASRMRLISVSTTSADCSERLPMTCAMHPLPAGAQATITVHAVPTIAGLAVNDARIAGSQTTLASDSVASATARTRVLAALQLTKTASVRTVDAGGRLHYTMLVRNPTPGTVRDVRVCDALPAGLGLVSASVRTHMREGSLCWKIVSLAPHAHEAFTLTTDALRGATGEITNTATISGPEIETEHASARILVVAAPAVETGVTG